MIVIIFKISSKRSLAAQVLPCWAANERLDEILKIITITTADGFLKISSKLLFYFAILKSLEVHLSMETL